MSPHFLPAIELLSCGDRADDRLDFKPPQTETVMETSSHDDERMQDHQAADRGAASVLPLNSIQLDQSWDDVP